MNRELAHEIGRPISVSKIFCLRQNNSTNKRDFESKSKAYAEKFAYLLALKY